MTVLVCKQCGHIFEGDENATCPQCQGPTVQPGDTPNSVLIIEFAGPGMAEFAMKHEGIVTPNQIAAVGAFLSSRADHIWQQQLADMMEAERAAKERQTGKIVTPEMVMTAQMGRD